MLLVRQALIGLPDLDPGSQEKRQLAERADECANLIRQTLIVLWDNGGGIINRAMGVRAPIYFLLKWFEHRPDPASLRSCQQLEARYRAEVPFLDWDFMLPLSLSSIYSLS